jgi:transcriptional antiterminator RfaH
MELQKFWFVVHTKPRQEEAVAFYLKQKELEIYLPRMETYTYRGLKRFTVIKPLFPNYLFIRCERKKLPLAYWTRGVKKVLWENQSPQPVAEELIFSIKSLASEDGIIRRPLSPHYRKNDQVLITAGPFKGITALFDHWEQDQKRVSLLLNLLNAQVRVTLPAALIAAA